MIKKFSEYTNPVQEIKEDPMDPSVEASASAKTHNIEMLQNFTKSYQTLNENLERAEEFIALFEQFSKEKEDLIRRQEVENILTTHLLIVNENIQDIKSSLNGINQKDLTHLQSVVKSIEEKTKLVLEYVDLEIPKVKKSLVESKHKQNLDLTKFAEEFRDYGRTVGDLTHYKEEVKEEVAGLALQVANNYQAVRDNKDELEKQIISVYRDVQSVNKDLDGFVESYEATINPIINRINEFDQSLTSIDNSVNQYNTTIEQTKNEIRAVVNEVNTIFINSKYEELDRKIEKINEIYNGLTRPQLNEETDTGRPPVPPASPVQMGMDVPDVQNINAKIKWLEQSLGRIIQTGPGSGEVKLRWLDDIDRSTIQSGYFLRYNGNTGKFDFADATAGDLTNPFDRITNGDYSAVIDESGNVSLPANATVAGALVVGNAGDETEGIDVNGTTYKSSFIVTDIGGEDQAQAILHRHSTSQEPLIVGARSNTDDDTDADVTNGMSLMSMIGTGYVGSDYQLFGQVQISAADDGILSATNSPGKITLQITEEGHNSDLYTAFSVTGKNVNILDRWDFNTDGTTSFPDDTLKTNAPLTVNVTAGDNAPATIILTGADWLDANGTYKRSYGVTPPTWTKENSPTTIVYDSGWNVRNDDAFGAGVSIYVNTGTLASPVSQWNISPPLGSVAPTGIYKNAEWVFGVDSQLTAPGDIVPDTDNAYYLGSPTKQWAHLYVSNNTIYLNNVPLSLKETTANNYTISIGSGAGGNTQNDLATQEYVQAFQHIDGGSARAVYSADLINVDGGGA